jgi:hypothetical protein
MATTLVLTRKPNHLFQSTEFRTQHGRFGTLILLTGSKVKAVQVVPAAGAPSGAISVPAGVLDLTTVDGGDVREIKRYTTIERMDGMIQLAPQEHIGTNNSDTYKGALYRVGPFGLSFEPDNSKVLDLKTALKSNPRLYAKANGNCFHVQGGLRPKEHAILIHAAPHVGWLDGCIGPRRWKDMNTNSTESCFDAMRELVAIGPRPSELFVVDW